MDQQDDSPERLRRAEAVLARRTGRVVLVLEQPWNDKNVQAVLRTAESFGIQHVWTVRHPQGLRRVKRSVTRGCHDWLSLRTFESSVELLVALREAGCAIWATDLSSTSEAVTCAEELQPVPERVAIVVGREVDGVSEELLRAADRRLHLPMRGFTESFNLSVATALFLQRLFDADPGLVGALAEDARLGGSDERKRGRYLDYLDSPPAPLADPRPSDAHRRPRFDQRKAWKREDG